jgi:hypothetical protein
MEDSKSNTSEKSAVSVRLAGGEALYPLPVPLDIF